MADFYGVVISVCLIIGFILGRWPTPTDYVGDVIVSKSSETCTFTLDIPAEEIPQYSELTFRVVTEEEHHNV